ncbi:alpha/beta hydrolase [Microbulbifer sp. A4B17]|uniref:alpha/beta hydrolase n=1 Tax=Microbulbifer sp. A4B17 TaxID=359370 RepID=UPI000D52BD83|nr:alpha/beta hydrolase [Microbulbifer sp. A4B17]AWF80182.1 alpha/beta hydrolase [Microbulbifer sp. A4B17]
MPALQLSDSRTLTYEDYGDPNGWPVIFNHGFSDSRLIRNPDNNLTASLGVRIISADQPGVGGSSPLRGRRMVDWGKDMEELADHLDVQTFSVIGHSGGAPHALSIANKLPDRVNKVVLASPVGPLDYPGMTDLLRHPDIKLIAKLHRWPSLIRWLCRLSAYQANRNIKGFIQQNAKKDASDAALFLRDPALKKMFEESFLAGVAQKGEGLFEMIMALWHWGFDPSNIEASVKIFYGDADDIIDTQMSKQLSSLLPNSATQIWHQLGHYGFVNKYCWVDLLKSARN